jgi:SAM-dependent methyltransferase
MAMVKACQGKFSGLEFVAADAANLSGFRDGSFDAVVFSFNGIDYVLPEQRRRSSWEHIYRVLKPGGRLIFSSHNPRAFVVRRSWNRQRIQQIARRMSLGSATLQWMMWTIFASARATLVFFQTLGATAMRVFTRVPLRMFWRGEGTRMDSAHGGLMTHFSTPRRVLRELTAFGFRPVRVLGDDYPRKSHILATDWYYYVFIKPCRK